MELAGPPSGEHQAAQRANPSLGPGFGVGREYSLLRTTLGSRGGGPGKQKSSSGPGGGDVFLMNDGGVGAGFSNVQRTHMTCPSSFNSFFEPKPLFSFSAFDLRGSVLPSRRHIEVTFELAIRVLGRRYTRSGHERSCPSHGLIRIFSPEPTCEPNKSI